MVINHLQVLGCQVIGQTSKSFVGRQHSVSSSLKDLFVLGILEFRKFPRSNPMDDQFLGMFERRSLPTRIGKGGPDSLGIIPNLILWLRLFLGKKNPQEAGNRSLGIICPGCWVKRRIVVVRTVE